MLAPLVAIFRPLMADTLKKNRVERSGGLYLATKTEAANPNQNQIKIQFQIQLQIGFGSICLGLVRFDWL